MAQQLHFKHKTGSRKRIAGVKAADLEPRLVVRSVFQPIIGRNTDVMDRDPSHIVKVNLAELPDLTLTEVEEKLPDRIKERRLEAKADEYIRVEAYNKNFINTVRRLEINGEVCDVKLVDVDAAEVLATPSLDLAEIAWADYVDRGIEIPANIKSANREKIAAWEETRKRASKATVAAPAPIVAPVEPVTPPPAPVTPTEGDGGNDGGEGGGDDTPPVKPKGGKK